MRILHSKKRPIIYSIVISIGLVFLLNAVRTFTDKYFFTFALVLYAIIIFELLSTKYYASELLNQFALKEIDNTYHKIFLLHQILIPSILYWTIIVFIYFNHQRSIDLVTIILCYSLFYVLFNNIRAHYENKFVLEQSTSGIYDVISLISSYFFLDSVIKFFVVNNYNIYFTLPMFLVVIGLFGILSMIRLNINIYKTLKDVSIFLVIATIGYLALLFLFRTQADLTAFFTPLILYYFIAYEHHKRDNSLTKAIIGEYVVVFLLLIVLLIGIF